MLRLIRVTFSLLSPQEKRRGFLLLLMILFKGLVEMLSVVSVAPFLAVAGNPSLVESNHYLLWLYHRLGYSNTQAFLIFLGFCSIAALVFSSFYKMVTNYAMSRFSNMRLHSISLRLFKNYLRQPYGFFLNHNSSDMSKSMLTEVQMAVNQVMVQFVNMLSGIVISISISTMLIIADPALALIMTTFLGGSYMLIFYVLKGKILKLGKARRLANAKKFKTVSETFGGIKELKVLGRENAYLKAFTRPSLDYARYHTLNSIISTLPRFVIEALGYSAILLIAIYGLSQKESSLGTVLPLLGMYALGAQQLLPSLQTVYSAISNMRFGSAAAYEVYEDLKEPEQDLQTNINLDPPPLNMKRELRFENINFSYSGANKPAIKDFSYAIPAGSSLGIIGTTGAGKTTLVDILLGLLIPQSGKIIIDDVVLEPSNIRAWQKTIGYVPQHIFLADESITNNIAFGVSDEKIDKDMVEKVAQMAQIHDFIITLPKAYETEIGERGVRLSGGQRQRIGIARALYHNPDILVLDEATSALDNTTEAEVVKSIELLAGTKTIIMIAHRLTTIEKCDRVLKLDAGQIVSDD